MLQYSEQFDPDIQQKHIQLLNHITTKNKACEELVKLLKQLCDIEHFYSKNLDRFANSISKLINGKDPLKQILIVFQRMIATKSQQSATLALNIKDDMIPYLTQQLIKQTKQQQLRNKQKDIKNIRNQMAKKLRMLYLNQNAYKKVSCNIKSQPNNNENIIVKNQAYTNLTNTIHDFNHSVYKYMQSYSKICQQFSQIEAERIAHIRDGMNKYMIFEMNNCKNIQYGITKYIKTLEQTDGKLLVQDITPMANSTSTIKLAKISVQNYITGLMEDSIKEQDSKSTSSQFNANTPQVQFILFLKRNFKLPCKMGRQDFHSIVMKSFSLLNDALLHNELTFARQLIANYSEGFYMQLQAKDKFQNSIQCNDIKIKITLLDCLLTHEIFKKNQIWNQYESRLVKKVKRQLQITSKQNKESIKTLISLDIQFLKLIQKTQSLQKVMNMFQQISQERRRIFDLKKHQNNSNQIEKTATEANQSSIDDKKSQNSFNQSNSILLQDNEVLLAEQLNSLS